jgi:transcription elongation GreA/GreB family factor
MKHELLVLDEDKDYARQRIAELESEITALGPEFYSAFNETSETWHDNAPFEAVRDKQTLLSTELQNLKYILRSSLPSIPKQKKGMVGIGSKVKIVNVKTKKVTTYIIAGDWTSRAGHLVDGLTIISRKSPLATTLIGKKAGQEFVFKDKYTIESIE